jgi:7,8-dihydroneopterin aldolase/epimerase/oxygenase
MPDTIHIRGLETPCFIGAGEEERSVSQNLRLDLEMVAPDGLHGLGDDLARTLDYHAIALAVQAVAASRPRRLVETLAEDVLDLLRDQFGIVEARVTVRKFILPFAEWVGVTLVRPQSLDKLAGAATFGQDPA